MIRLIVAADQKLGIAKKGFQPWYIPEDDAYFSRVTKLNGGSVLVGKTTFKTFSRPLDSRNNYVLSSSSEPLDGATLVNDLDTFLRKYNDEDIWVIGGASVFEQVLKRGNVEELYITHIEANFGCDQYFPCYKSDFILREQSETHEQNGFKFSYAIYDRAESLT